MIEENCHYCGKVYTPRRRGAQKFCSDTCRNKNWQHAQRKKKISAEIKEPEVPQVSESQKTPMAVEQMSLPGVGNAAAGAALAKFVDNVLTKEDNKPATKGDFKKLTALIKGAQYFPVKNMAKSPDGLQPYFDLMTYKIVYF